MQVTLTAAFPPLFCLYSSDGPIVTYKFEIEQVRNRWSLQSVKVIVGIIVKRSLDQCYQECSF